MQNYKQICLEPLISMPLSSVMSFKSLYKSTQAHPCGHSEGKAAHKLFIEDVLNIEAP